MNLIIGNIPFRIIPYHNHQNNLTFLKKKSTGLLIACLLMCNINRNEAQGLEMVFWVTSMFHVDIGQAMLCWVYAASFQ